MEANLAYMFPGQGSQTGPVELELFRKHRDLAEAASEVLGYSVEELWVRRDERLRQTEFTQPGMYVLNALSYAELRESQAFEMPACFIGHSLGEYNALLAAGVFDFETGLKLVKARAAAMARCDGGGMAAVIGCDRDELANLIASEGLSELDIANLNAPNQQVVAGPTEELQRARSVIKARKLGFVPLPVSGAFHSRQMVGAAREFVDVIREFTFEAPCRPTVSNVGARPYRASEVARLLVAQIHQPVRWQESVAFLAREGVTRFVEVGPGKVLTGLVEAFLNASEGAPPDK